MQQLRLPGLLSGSSAEDDAAINVGDKGLHPISAGVSLLCRTMIWMCSSSRLASTSLSGTTMYQRVAELNVSLLAKPMTRSAQELSQTQGVFLRPAPWDL